MADCSKCKSKNITVPEKVPYIVHESAMARAERQNKRMWIAFVVAIVMIVVTNIGWLLYEMQFETLTYEQTSDGINNINYGHQGELNNGAESEDKEETQEQRTGIESTQDQ